MQWIKHLGGHRAGGGLHAREGRRGAAAGSGPHDSVVGRRGGARAGRVRSAHEGPQGPAVADNWQTRRDRRQARALQRAKGDQGEAKASWPSSAEFEAAGECANAAAGQLAVLGGEQGAPAGPPVPAATGGHVLDGEPLSKRRCESVAEEIGMVAMSVVKHKEQEKLLVDLQHQVQDLKRRNQERAERQSLKQSQSPPEASPASSKSSSSSPLPSSRRSKSRSRIHGRRRSKSRSRSKSVERRKSRSRSRSRRRSRSHEQSRNKSEHHRRTSQSRSTRRSRQSRSRTRSQRSRSRSKSREHKSRTKKQK